MPNIQSRNTSSRGHREIKTVPQMRLMRADNQVAYLKQWADTRVTALRYLDSEGKHPEAANRMRRQLRYILRSAAELGHLLDGFEEMFRLAGARELH